MASSLHGTKPQSTGDVHSPLAKGSQKLLRSLDALITVVAMQEKNPSRSHVANAVDGSTHSFTGDSRRIVTLLCSRLRSLLACIQKIQRATLSRIDEEIDASHILEIN